MSFRSIILSAALLLVCAGSSAAQAVKLEFLDGRVNLSAQNAPVRVILAEWARLGGTRIVDGDRVAGAPLTLELQGYPERQALDIVLRAVPGYMLAAREALGTGASSFDRIMILPTTTTPKPTGTAATFAPPPPIAQFADDLDDDVTALERNEQRQEALRRAEEARQRAEQLRQQVIVGQTQFGTPGAAGTVNVNPVPPQPFLPQPAASEPPPPPGPASSPLPSNPFTSLPGSSRPGEVTPVPEQPDNRPPNTTPNR